MKVTVTARDIFGFALEAPHQVKSDTIHSLFKHSSGCALWFSHSETETVKLEFCCIVPRHKEEESEEINWTVLHAIDCQHKSSENVEMWKLLVHINIIFTHHLEHSSDLTPCNFLHFPQIKIRLKDTRGDLVLLANAVRTLERMWGTLGTIVAMLKMVQRRTIDNTEHKIKRTFLLTARKDIYFCLSVSSVLILLYFQTSAHMPVNCCPMFGFLFFFPIASCMAA